MSYDLYFEAREGSASADASAFAEYFRGRPNYEVTDQQALYENETTGVYFIFNLGDVGMEERPDLLPASFELNYFRPHIFGLEAEPEVKSFVQHFGLRVFDPQVGGMGDGEYSTEGFFNGWNTGNEYGYRSVLSRHADMTVMTLPRQRIEECWRWNSEVEQLQAQFGEDVFVPRFMFVALDGVVKSLVVWPDAIPTAVPQADLVFIPRKDILPRKFFRSREDMVIAEWNQLEEMLAAFPLQQAALPYRLLSYQKPPNELVEALRSLVATEDRTEGVPVDKILNAEMVEKVRWK